MRILEADPKELNNEQLHELIVSLQRSETDFEKRLAAQVGALERAGRMHGSDPVYQSLFFLMRKFTKQLRRAEKELTSRDVNGRASVRPHGRLHSEAVELRFNRRAMEQSSPFVEIRKRDAMKAIQDPLEAALDAALEMTFPASDPIAVHMMSRIQANSAQTDLMAKPAAMQIPTV